QRRLQRAACRSGCQVRRRTRPSRAHIISGTATRGEARSSYPGATCDDIKLAVSFTPIAIVGQSCVLPGALDPGALWENVVEGRSAIGPAPLGRWRLEGQRILGSGADCTFTDRGGYVSGFAEVWDPEGFALPAASLRGLDPLFQWVLHTGREALRPV